MIYPGLFSLWNPNKSRNCAHCLIELTVHMCKWRLFMDSWLLILWLYSILHKVLVIPMGETKSGASWQKWPHQDLTLLLHHTWRCMGDWRKRRILYAPKDYRAVLALTNWTLFCFEWITFWIQFFFFLQAKNYQLKCTTQESLWAGLVNLIWKLGFFNFDFWKKKSGQNTL